jgi:dTDP-3-amino-3,4,6-trideoxy-alpha-D-glucose transaminase
MIPQVAPWLRIARFREAIDARIAATLSSHQYILGPEVERFEAGFAEFLGVQHCVAVACGTDALTLGLRALGIGAGDEVITVSMTAAATATAILQCSAVPRFVDIDRSTRCMDIAHLAAAISPRTAAILPVHLHGYPVDMVSIMALAERHGLAVLEDCAQAHGADLNRRRVGGFGHLAAFSFYPTKNLGGVGDGGALATRDAALATKVRALRAYGWGDQRRISDEFGYNSRLDELQAAILNVLLAELEEGNEERRALATQYRAGLQELASQSDIELPLDHPGAVHHQFAIAVAHRDTVRSHLQRAGIATGVHYAPALHQQPAYAAYAPDPLIVTESMAERFISLPIQPEAVQNGIPRIVAAVGEAIQTCTPS